MKVITYLGFTLLSILIQFCVMDYIQGNIRLEEEQLDLEETSQKKRFDDMIKSISRKPHALYYRTHANNKSSLKVTSKSYSNISVPETEISTMMTSTTIVEEFYDENMSTTTGAFTTETLYTTTDIDNITEITLLSEKKNKTTVKPNIPKKILRNNGCGCDLLYKVCDINCCCDNDCAEREKMLFRNCSDSPITNEESQYSCYHFDVSRKLEESLFDNLFCIAKTNLPDKRNINSKKYDIGTVDRAYKWHTNEILKHTEFQRKPYAYGDTVWVLKEGYIWYIDIPSPMINNYCSGRRPILFLKEESAKCSVHLKDLEMFQIFNTSQESFCVSVVEKSVDSATLNCSTLHCTNWTIVICDEDGNRCSDYNNTIHEPSCNESYCTNIALRLDYIFHYYDSRITNATIKFFVKNIPAHIQFMAQVINVRYVMTNASIDKIIKVSGNPGYVYGLPVISSTAKSNHTLHFFNSTLPDRRFLTQPANKEGSCVSYNSTNNFVKFGINKSMKCRYVHNKPIFSKLNSTQACDEIEHNIKQLCGLTEKIFVSALGNPIENKDIDWLLITNNLQDKEVTYGQFLAKNSRLRCYNLIVRISYIITFADMSEVHPKREDKIIAVNISVATQNVTFSAEDISTILTMDTNFIDGTKQKEYEYAGAPHLKLHLPKDFFFPFSSNGDRAIKLNIPLVKLCIAIYWQIK